MIRQIPISRLLILIFFLFIYHVRCAVAQVKKIEISPEQTDSAIRAVHGAHVALYDETKADTHRLIVMIVGTNGAAKGSIKTDSVFAAMGFHVIALDYSNKVAAVSCSNSKDPLSFDHYREEIITGNPVSELVQVNPANGILNRFEKALLYLAKQDPKGNWTQFIENGGPKWSAVVVAGHSQGSGHAAYLAKMFKVDRVLMFSGPQDYSKVFLAPAAWQSRKSATPPNRYFAFLHLKDPYDVSLQIADCQKLMQLDRPETEQIVPYRQILSKKQILITNVPGKHLHSSVLRPEFKNVWEYMLNRDISEK